MKSKRARVTAASEGTSLLPRPARQWVRVGPGLVLAGLAALAFVWLHVMPQRTPPRIPTASVGASPQVAMAPDPAWVMSRLGTLGLSPGQETDMKARVERWQRDTRALREDLDLAARAFQAPLAASPQRAVSVQEIQERGQSVSLLSRQLAHARRAWWDDASRILTAPQRQQVEHLWLEQFPRTSPPVQGTASPNEVR